jgi:TPR repeat protein
MVGRMYGDGDGIRRDDAAALKWLRLAAEQGFAGAQNDIGAAFAKGLLGLKQDLSEARKWYTLAAQNGSATAQNNLADLDAFLRPKRVEPAQDLYDEGSRLYKSGQKEASAKPFLAAAQAGNSNAQIQIAWHYLKGVGVPQNASEAAKWYRKSSETGNSEGMWNLGLLYENGQGVNEDWVAAARWYQKSADLDNSIGQRQLAFSYQFGIGVPQSRSLAYQWHRRANAHGDGQSRQWAKTLSQGGPIGFRAPEERNMFFMQFAFPDGLEPEGVLFHSSNERLAFVAGVASHYRFRPGTSRASTGNRSSSQSAGSSGSGCGAYCGDYAATAAYKAGDIWSADRIKNGTANPSEKAWFNH